MRVRYCPPNNTANSQQVQLVTKNNKCNECSLPNPQRGGLLLFILAHTRPPAHKKCVAELLTLVSRDHAVT